MGTRKMLYTPLDPQFAPPFVERFQESLVLINYLAGKLADTETELYLLQQKTELWLQSQSTNDKQN